jgi:hypothetical protein
MYIDALNTGSYSKGPSSHRTGLPPRQSTIYVDVRPQLFGLNC